MNVSTGRTFKQHLIDFASALGHAEQSSTGLALPTDAVTLDMLKRKYNEGLSLMVADNPNGWYCLRPNVEITITTDTTDPQLVDGDITQYRLPHYVSGDPIFGWNWLRPNGTLNGVCESRDWDTVTRLLNANRGAGLPQCVATRAYVEQTPDGTEQVVYLLRVYPRPNETYTMSGMFSVNVGQLSSDTQRHPFGSIHDMTVLAAAKWAWVRDDSTDARRQNWERDYAIRLALSIDADNRAAPTTGPSMLDQNAEVWRKLPQTVYINGTALT